MMSMVRTQTQPSKLPPLPPCQVATDEDDGHLRRLVALILWPGGRLRRMLGFQGIGCKPS